MPSITTPSGQQAVIPGVYSDFEVVSDLAGPLPAFNVPLLVAEAEEGYPFDVRQSMLAHETLDEFQLKGTASAAKSFYGGDSDLGVAMTYAKRHQLPQAYCVAINSLTRASIIATSTGPVNEMTIVGQKYGAPSNYIKISFTGGIMSATPLRNFSRFTADTVATDTRIFVRDNSWINVDTTYTIGSNTITASTATVVAKGTELDANSQVLYFVEFSAAVGGILTEADDAMIVEYDDNAVESSPAFSAGEGQLLLDWLQQTSEFLNGKAEATFSGTLPIDVASATALKDISAWGTVTAGTTPDQTATDHSDFISDLNAGEWDRFASSQQVVLQSFFVATGDSTAHASWRDFEIQKRGDGYAISVMSGVRWGDHVLSAGDDTDPLFRLAALNNQGFALACGHMDKLAPYLSLGPAVWGLRVGNAIPHNLTNDDLLYSTIDHEWDELESGELTALLKAGALTYKLSIQESIRYRVAQGLSSLQSNSSSWNELTDDSPLLMQRDNADYVDRIIKLELDRLQVGADVVTAGSVASVLRRKADKSLVRRGLVKAFRIVSVTLNASGAGYDIEWTVQLPDTVDFITVKTTIYIGESL